MSNSQMGRCFAYVGLVVLCVGTVLAQSSSHAGIPPPPPANPCGGSPLIGGGSGGGGGSVAPPCIVPLEYPVSPESGPPNPKNEGTLQGSGVDPKTGIDPIRLVSGSMVLSETDIVIPCPMIDLVFMREYDSNLLGGENLGFRWVHSYDWTIEKLKESGGELGDWLVLRAIADPNKGAYEGGYHFFKRLGDGTYTVSHTSPYILTVDQAGEYDVKITGGTVYHFDVNGVLQNIVHPAGQRVDLTYVSGKLVRVEHSNGKYLQFAYNSVAQIKEITTPSTNLSVSFTYDVGDGVPTQSTMRPLLLKTTRHTPRGDFMLTYGYGQPEEVAP